MKKLIFAFIFVLIIGGVFYSNTNWKGNVFKTITKIDEITVSQQVGDSKPNKITIIERSTALDLLNKEFQTQTKGEKENAFVIKISDRIADETKREFWAFYVNGKQSQVGAGSYILMAGDKIQWKIEKY